MSPVKNVARVGGTDRIAAERAVKLHAARSQGIKVRRANVRVAIAAQRLRALIVREDENHIHRLRH
jgi:hypothetical protein